MEATIRRADWGSKKNEVKKALEKAYDDLIERKKGFIIRYIKEKHKSDLKGKDLEKEIERVFELIPKNKFVNTMISDIENNSVQKRGVTAMIVDVKELKEILNQNEAADLLRMAIIAITPFIGLLLVSIIAFFLTVDKGVSGMLDQSKKHRVRNEYFEARWNGMTQSALLAQITNGLFFDRLEMNIVPRFKLKG